MDENYIFKVVSREVKSYSGTMDEKINITIHETSIDSLRLYFSLKIDKTKDHIVVNAVSFSYNLYTGHSLSNDRERVGYLKGYFGFSNEYEIEKALLQLQNSLNGSQTDSKFFTSKWQYFSDHFKSWFDKKLRICLEKELELIKLYFS